MNSKIWPNLKKLDLKWKKHFNPGLCWITSRPKTIFMSSFIYRFQVTKGTNLRNVKWPMMWEAMNQHKWGQILLSHSSLQNQLKRNPTHIQELNWSRMRTSRGLNIAQRCVAERSRRHSRPVQINAPHVEHEELCLPRPRCQQQQTDRLFNRRSRHPEGEGVQTLTDFTIKPFLSIKTWHFLMACLMKLFNKHIKRQIC